GRQSGEGEKHMSWLSRRLAITVGSVLAIAWGIPEVGAQEIPHIPSCQAIPSYPISPAPVPAVGLPGTMQAPVAAPRFGWWQRCCQRWRACCLGYPEEFEAQPLGASLNAFAQTQAANGEAAQMVLYQADFVEGTGKLSPRGHERLARIAA